MSTGDIAVPYPAGREERPPAGPHPLLQWGRRLSPRQGWLTFFLLFVSLSVVAETVSSARWVETPGLMKVLFLSALTGLLLAKVRLPWPPLVLGGLVLGAVVVIWQTSYVLDPAPVSAQLAEMWERLVVWYQGVTGDEIVTDLLPFTLGILAMAWLLGFIASWFLFRGDNVWVAVVLGGTLLLTNLSFLPAEFAPRFFLFVFFAMLLVVRMSIYQRQRAWQEAGLKYDPVSSTWLTVHAAVWFSLAVVLLSAFLPMRVLVSHTLARAWADVRSPLERVEEVVSELLMGIPSRKDVPGRFFGRSLPFLGKVSFGEEVVMTVDSPYPSYWLFRSYSRYTPQGWLAGPTRTITIEPDTAPPVQERLRRVPVTQTIRTTFSSKDLFVGGGVDWLGVPAAVEVLQPREFNIDLLNDARDQLLPEDLRQVARQLRGLRKKTPVTLFEAEAAKALPEDLVLTKVIFSIEGVDSIPERVVLQRKDPVVPDLVTWNATRPIAAGEAYQVISLVSLASDDELRRAGTDYPTFIRDHYLQLPEGLPDRVRELAQQLTQGAETPFDKAVAIQNYLRGPTFTYSQDITPPPASFDAVEYFLFVSKKGYSDYFASAMAVLLRSVGVPARLAVGYGPGEVDPETGQRLIRDSDSHAWVQVYFPRYGWIDFEPTPRWPEHERKLATPSNAVRGLEPGLIPADEGLIRDIFDPFIEGDLDAIPEGAAGTRTLADLGRLALPAGIAVGALVALTTALRIAWGWGLKGASVAEGAYIRMVRLGSLVGLRRRPAQTPTEYAAELGRTVPEAARPAHTIAAAYAANRYGHVPLADEGELEEAWRRVRGAIVAWALRRLVQRGRGQEATA